MYFLFFLLHLPHVYQSCDHLTYFILIFGYIYVDVYYSLIFTCAVSFLSLCTCFLLFVCNLLFLFHTKIPWWVLFKMFQKYRLLGHMCFSCYRTYVMILCNWFILWQNALYLYLGRHRMCLTTLRNHVSRSSDEAFKSVQNQERV